MHLAALIKLIKELPSLPRVTITLCGNSGCRDVYRRLTKRHPMFPLIQRNSLGAALLKLPGDHGDYTRGKKRQYVRTKLNRAREKNYTFSSFDPEQCLDQILEINGSAKERQGQQIAHEYLEKEHVRWFHSRVGQNFGVFDSEGRLRAYAYVPVCGELAVLGRIMGHYDFLDDGIIAMLVSEVVRELIARRENQGNPDWLLYGTFFGSAPGLQFAKKHMGFSPYRVSWRWHSGTDRTCGQN